MRAWLGRVGIVAMVLAFVAQPGVARAADPNHVGLTFSTVASGLTDPTVIAFTPDNRMLIADQNGVIFERVSGNLTHPFLDIHSEVLSGGERGLLGIAVHPNWAHNRYFYVFYTRQSDGALQVSQFQANSVPVATATEHKLITIAHPTYANHNGGELQFDKNGYLYIGTGDGGSGGDPSGNAQNLRSLLGKILRINPGVNCGSTTYCIPSSNPFASSSTVRHEIWQYGLRNPWRFSFDRAGGNLVIGDVGQDNYEEVDWNTSNVGGANWGWDCYEGFANTVSTYGGSYCSGRRFSRPLWVYAHQSGRCAIIGGYRYWGSLNPVLRGIYVYGDYCTGEIWGLAYNSGRWTQGLMAHPSGQILSFGESPGGELYVSLQSGSVFLVRASAR